jgi:WD40 repeat protein
MKYLCLIINLRQTMDKNIVPFGGQVYRVSLAPEDVIGLAFWTRNPAPLLTLEGHTSWVSSVAFSPEGRYALSGSRDLTVRLWNLTTGEQLAVFTGHTDEVLKVTFSPDGLTGYSTLLDGSLRVWDLSLYIGGE